MTALRWLSVATAAGALSLLAVSCSGKEVCSPSSCSGCCDTDGACQPGFLPQACGVNASVCSVCSSTQSCVGGFCTGGGGGGGGGNDGGGTPDGGATNGSATLSGALAFTVRSIRTDYSGLADGGHGLDYVSVVMADQQLDVCGPPGSVAQPVHIAGLQVGKGWPDGGIVTPGSYTIDNQSAPSDTGGVQALHALLLPDGGYTDYFSISQGTITFTQVDTTRSAGSFNVQFAIPDGGSASLSGSFNAPACP